MNMKSFLEIMYNVGVAIITVFGGIIALPFIILILTTLAIAIALRIAFGLPLNITIGNKKDA
jgi:hypothetical protein